MKFYDPLKNKELEFQILPIDKLKVISHQRKPSNYHVNHLILSMERLGFIVPPIVVKNPQKDEEYLILDGQHRFLAAQKLGIKELPVIIVPQEYMNLMMNFNIEKELNIREKAYVALQLYREILSEKPEILEEDPLLSDSIEKAYYVTLGLAYEKADKLAGSAFESILKKCDFFLDIPLQNAMSVREKRAERILRINEELREIAGKLKEMGKWHPYVYNQILSWANPYKRKRLPVDFEDLFTQIEENIEKAKESPELILEEVLEDSED